MPSDGSVWDGSDRKKEERTMPQDTYPKPRIASVQAAPVFLDRDATIKKMAVLAKEAADNGADLVIFPESFVPCYPVWCLVHAPIDQHSLFTRLYQNAVEVDTPPFWDIAEIARANKVFLSVGATEKARHSMGVMWNTNFLFDREGNMIGHHRKIVPTWAEKLVWSFGDGSSLKVHDTEIGRIGVLICGENTNTLARYSMLAQGEQFHIATYPPCWPIKRTTSFGGGYNIAEINLRRAAAHCFEGKVYTAVSSGVLDEYSLDQTADGNDGVREFLKTVGKPSSMIVGPDGEPVVAPLVGEEGIVYADIDIEKEIALKGIHDIVGSYQRFDIFKVFINQNKFQPAYFYSDSSPVDMPVAFDDSGCCAKEDE